MTYELTQAGRTRHLDLDEQLQIAEAIARGAHQAQVDKLGEPYIHHVEAVVAGVDTVRQKIVAWLHDVIEDTSVSYIDLRDEGIQIDLIELVRFLTRLPHQSKRRYFLSIVADADARAVKIADVKHNMSRLPQLRLIDPATAERLVIKYTEALDLLEDDVMICENVNHLLDEVQADFEAKVANYERMIWREELRLKSRKNEIEKLFEAVCKP